MHAPPHIVSLPRGTFLLTAELDLAYPLEEVFAFFSRPENLARLTPPSMGFVLLTSGPVDMKEGLELAYRIRPLKVPMTWVSRIQTWNPPHEFTDVQRKGPFRFWEHVHRFTATGTGTRIVDQVTYRVPGGRGVERVFVRQTLLRQFRYRAARMREQFPDRGLTPKHPSGPA